MTHLALIHGTSPRGRLGMAFSPPVAWQARQLCSDRPANVEWQVGRPPALHRGRRLQRGPVGRGLCFAIRSADSQCWLVALLTHAAIEALVTSREGMNCVRTVAVLAIGSRTDRVRDWIRRSGARNLRRCNQIADSGRVQAYKLPLSSMTSHVGAEAGVVGPSGVADVVALGASFIEYIPMLGKPV